MIKTILKETIITLLLCIAILLVLSIIFYDYNPLNKIVPSKIAYSTPEDIKNEIEQNEVKDVLEGGVNIVYSIDSSDLNIYKKSNSYVAGKANPFATLEEGTSSNVADNEQTNNKNGNKPANVTNTTKNPGNTGTILNSTGKK